ncbi:MAG: vWA domain-containing protein [Pirellulaceae bacterium]
MYDSDEPQDEAESADLGSEPDSRFRLRRWVRNSGAMVVSMVVHMAAVIVLSLLVIEQKLVPPVQEIVSQVFEEEPERELVKIELENQLTEVTEQTQQVFSSSPIVGAVGASGPQGLVSAPTMDEALLEQVVDSQVTIEGISIEVPSSKALIVEAPDGQIGDARAVVGSYAEALDRVTQEILWMLDKSNVLVVWAFDQSESMKDDQKEIRDRFEHVYDQLGLASKRDQDALETAVISFGAAYVVHTRRPTADRDTIRAAIDEIPNDLSGKEMMCSAVGQAIQTHRQYAQATRRQLAVILVTDESGDRDDNNEMLERAIAEAKSARCKVYVLGREAVFGYPYVHIRWVHPQTKHVHWLPIDRGPETAFVEQLQTDGFHRRYDAHPSGFGPYECSRLGRETGGVFFMLPSVESNLVHGQKRNYELETPYFPDFRARLEVKEEIDDSPLRTALEKVIYDLNPYNPAVRKIIEMKVDFPRDYEPFVRAARAEQAKAIVYLDYLARAEKTVAQLERQRKDEASPRWQANYDLLSAQLVAYQARMYEYGAYLEWFIEHPKTMPRTRPPDLTHVEWDIRTRKEILTGEKVQPYIDRATDMFKQVMADHPGTPWASRAEYELKRGFGVELVPEYDIPHPMPTTNLIPIPKL